MLPQPSWWEVIEGAYTDTTGLPWEMGIVDANTESAPETFYLANNHPDATEAAVDEDVPHMYSCRFTVVDADGSETMALVTGTDKDGEPVDDGNPWSRVKHADEADDEDNWTIVGGDDLSREIGHDGLEAGGGPVNDAISGDYNGTFDFDDVDNKNFFAFDFKLDVPEDAPSGPMSFLFRVTYDYVGLGETA